MDTYDETIKSKIDVVYCSSVVVVLMSKWIFEKIVDNAYKRHSCYCRAPHNPPRYHDLATPAPQISSLNPRQRNRRRCPTRRAGAGRGALPGTDLSLPGMVKNRKITEIPAQNSSDKHCMYQPMCCYVHCSIVIARPGWEGWCVSLGDSIGVWEGG